MKDKKMKDLTNEELSQKITDIKKQLNELTKEFHSRASIRLEIAEAEYAVDEALKLIAACLNTL